MRIPLIVILIILNFNNYTFGQNGCRSIENLIAELKKGNYVKNSKLVTGLGTDYPTIDSQFVRYQELKRCTSEEQLWKLTENENNIIRAYSWKAVLLLNPQKAFSFLKENQDNLKDRNIIKFLNGCQGSVKMKLLDFMISELYDRLLDGQIELTAKEIITFLNLKEKRSIARGLESLHRKTNGF